MKVKRETVLFKVLTGSHLYGTTTEGSDFDYKAVCLPSIDDLLLNTHVTNRKEKPEGVRDSDKMAAGDVETEYIPIQVFFNDFLDGQTYALELGLVFYNLWPSFFFGNDVLKISKSFSRLTIARFGKIMMELVDGYLTKNVQKMVGYAISQARLYGLKTQRFSAQTKILETILNYGDIRSELGDRKIGEHPSLINDLLNIPFVKESKILNAAGGKEFAPCLEICEKQFPLTNKIGTIVTSLQKSIKSYGSRVKEFSDVGVDWKALSHAIRITEQIVELCETGNIQFPRPNAHFLRNVKLGIVALEVAMDHLNAAFSKVDSVVTASSLREKTPQLEEQFKNWKINALHELYGIK